MAVIYNEIEPYAANWLVNLEAAGHIASGTVERRSIRDLRAADVAGATQFHAFAGIGVWSYALRLAGWPDERPVWTGSCPCQPFSVAGRRRGTADELHIWPAWFRLIRECHPPVIFGEQVASPAGLVWFDAVSSDLEGEGYAVGASDLCAAGVGAPHVRQRLFFVAYRSVFGRRERRALRRWGAERVQAQGNGQRPADDGGDRDVEHADEPRLEIVGEQQARTEHEAAERASASRMLDEPNRWRREGSNVHLRSARQTEAEAGVARTSSPGRMGNTGGEGSGGHRGAIPGTQGEGYSGGQTTWRVTHEPELAGYTRGFWADAEWLLCRDGKTRPAEPGAFPLAHGHSGRVAVVRPGAPPETHWYSRTGALKCIGNAIVPQVAATFIRAAVEG